LVHSNRQLLRKIGFGEHLAVKGAIAKVAHGAEPRSVKDFNAGPQLCCPFGEGDAVGLAGHQDIGEKEIDRQTLIKYGEGNPARSRLHEIIALVTQHLKSKFSDVVRVLDDKNKPSASGPWSVSREVGDVRCNREERRLHIKATIEAIDCAACRVLSNAGELVLDQPI